MRFDQPCHTARHIHTVDPACSALLLAARARTRSWFGSAPLGVCLLSAADGRGVPELVQALAQAAISGEKHDPQDGEAPLITRARHRGHLQRCLAHLDQFDGGSLSLASFEPFIVHWHESLLSLAGSFRNP